jgi:hypothetical protein
LALNQQIAAAQRRLWTNRFLAKLTITFAVGVFLFAVIWTLQRLFDFHWPVQWIGASIGALILISATVWTYGDSRRCPDRKHAPGSSCGTE